jgi:hypothetical protein
MRWVLVAAVFGAVMGHGGVALAHGDARLVDEMIVIEPGGTATFVGEVHYHRLIGRFEADGPIVVELSRGLGSEAVVLEGPADSIAVNVLVPCCHNRAWTPHVLIIENPGRSAVSVDARATLVHDDLSVMVYGAESGTEAAVVWMGGLWALVLWRVRRRSASMPPVRSVRAFVVLAACTIGLAAYGASRYGSGSVGGLLGGLADVPIVPFNPIVSRASALLLIGMIGWSVVGARWVRSAGMLSLGRWMGMGCLVLGAVLVAGTLIALGYSAVAMPIAMGLVAIVPLALVALGELSARRSGHPTVATTEASEAFERGSP